MPVTVQKRVPPALSLTPLDDWNWIGLSPKGKRILFGEGEWVRSFEKEFFELCHPAHGVVEWYPGHSFYIVIALIRRGEAVRVLAHPTLIAERDPAECAREAFHMAFGGRLGVR